MLCLSLRKVRDGVPGESCRQMVWEHSEREDARASARQELQVLVQAADVQEGSKISCGAWCLERGS